MFYHQATNKYIQESTQFELEGITYPPQWLNQATPEQKYELGLEEVIVTNEPYNPVYYWTSETLDGASLTYTGIPKDIAAVQKYAITQIDSTAYAMLLPTDYIEARNLRNPEYKQDWMLWRDSIRLKAKETIALINAATNVDDIAAIVNSVVWNNDPDYVMPADAVNVDINIE